MKKLLSIALLIAIALVGFAATPATEAQDSVELRILWYNDGNEGEVMQDLLDRFEEETGISVELDTVAYTDLDTKLQTQVEAGGGDAPDIARVTDTARYRQFYLDISGMVEDPAYWEENFADPVLDSFRLDPESHTLHGFPTQFTITGPFINRTLFEQAGVDVPSDVMDAPTWEDWTNAAVEVADITGVSYAVAIDRSGHRFWGPSITMGAEYFDEDGNIVVDSEGFRAAAQMLVDWHDEGITPVDVWVGSGDQYASAKDEFVTGNLVFYMSGSWQIQSFASDIGDTFDWAAVPNPSGPGGSTGIPGGAVLAAMNTTEHPEEVAMLMDWLASEDVLREFTARTLFIPGHIGIANSGVEYDTDNEAVLAALNTFLAEVPKLDEQAYALQYSPLGFTLNTNIRDRLTQVIVGELTLDEAIQRIQEAVDEAAAEMNAAE